MLRPSERYASDLMESLAPTGPFAWQASLRVDETDKFFFDHELDHVPGMLLVEACLQAVEGAAALSVDGFASQSLFFSEVRFEFQRFCEHGLPTQICVTSTQGQPTRWRAQVVQAGAVLADGRMVISPSPRDLTGVQLGSAVPVRAGKALVHKRHQENVLIGPMTRGEDAMLHVSVAEPLLRERWAGRGGDQRSAGELIEAGRQFGTLVMHTVRGLPFDSQFVLQSFTMTLKRPVFRGESVELLGQPGPLRRHHTDGIEVLRASGEPVGRLTFSATLLPQAVYLRLRRAGRSSQELPASQRSA